MNRWLGSGGRSRSSRLEGLDDDRARLVDALEQLALGHPADEVARSARRRRARRRRCAGCRAPSDRRPARRRRRRGCDLRASGIATVSRSSWSSRCTSTPRSRRVSAKRVVLLLGALDPEHVVEEVVVLVGGRQPLQLEVRAVQDRLPQAADLGVDVEGHASHSSGLARGTAVLEGPRSSRVETLARGGPGRAAGVLSRAEVRRLGRGTTMATRRPGAGQGPAPDHRQHRVHASPARSPSCSSSRSSVWLLAFVVPTGAYKVERQDRRPDPGQLPPRRLRALASPTG